MLLSMKNVIYYWSQKLKHLHKCDMVASTPTPQLMGDGVRSLIAPLCMCLRIMKTLETIENVFISMLTRRRDLRICGSATNGFTLQACLGQPQIFLFST